MFLRRCLTGTSAAIIPFAFFGRRLTLKGLAGSQARRLPNLYASAGMDHGWLPFFAGKKWTCRVLAYRHMQELSYDGSFSGGSAHPKFVSPISHVPAFLRSLFLTSSSRRFIRPSPAQL